MSRGASDVEVVDGVNADAGVMMAVGPTRAWGVPMVCTLVLMHQEVSPGVG